MWDGSSLLRLLRLCHDDVKEELAGPSAEWLQLLPSLVVRVFDVETPIHTKLLL